MNITIDFSGLQEAASSPFTLVWYILTNGGWVVAAVLLVYGLGHNLFHAWLSNRQRAYLAKIKYIMLALDVPKGNEQTPKAVEAIFAHLHGIAGKGNLIDRYWKGKIQAQLSFEIIGIEGQTQFLIRTPVDYRDVIEASVYAQYPDAAVTEVLDYTTAIPDDYIAAGYDLWGTELTFANSTVFPIRTYPYFEHTMTQQFLDPLGSLLELMGRLGPTEQIWLQLVISPAGTDWKSEAEKEVKKRLGVKLEEARSLLSNFSPTSIGGMLYGATTGVVATSVASIWKLPEDDKKKKEEKKDAPKKFSDLTPSEKAVIEGIQLKISKLAWETKFRFIYLAQKEFFKPSRGVTGVTGALKQYATNEGNAFKPEEFSKTGVDYWFVKRRVLGRKQRILHNFKTRQLLQKFQWKNPWTRKSGKPIIMNTEELASLYHFPVITVKAPQVQKTDAKRGEPPMGLPVDTFPVYTETTTDHSAMPSGQPPSNLPT